MSKDNIVINLDTLNLLEKVFTYSTSTIVIIIGIVNICFLCSQKNKIPFSNISPNLLIITIAGIFI
jgi:hypothetical protein